MINPAIAIDIGTSRIKLCSLISDTEVNEPAICAQDPMTCELIACGNDALKLCGSISSDVNMISPLKSGAVENFPLLCDMLKMLLKKTVKSRFGILSPKTIMTYSPAAAAIQTEELVDAVKNAGLRDIELIERPLAHLACYTQSLDPQGGYMIIDSGAGITEITVICLNKIVSSQALTVAGEKFDSDIILRISKKCGVLIGKKTAERIKLGLNKEELFEFCGRSLQTGYPAKGKIAAKELIRCFDEDINRICSNARQMLEALPSSLAGEITANGVILTGASAVLPNLKQRLSEKLNCEVIISDNYNKNPAQGFLKLLESNGDIRTA